MRQGLITLTACALLALAAPAGLAQEPEDELDDEPAVEESAPRGCERGPGTDADYAYCPDPCIDDESTDADYVYCVQANSGGEPPRSPKRRTRAAAVQALPAQTLPVTGGEPWLIASCGAGFLLAGTGLRLRAQCSRLR